MKLMFYPKFAFDGIKKNSKTYLPFCLSSMFIVGMYYILQTIAGSPSLIQIKGGDVLKEVLSFGCIVVAIFGGIFILYSNSFSIKRRLKEFGLLRVLGLNKKNISWIAFWETLILAGIVLSGGFLGGFLFGKVAFLFLLKILGITSPLTYGFDLYAIEVTLAIFGVVFFLVFLYNLMMTNKTNPLTLFQQSKAGEIEPKNKWLLALIGVITLGVGYYMALSVKAPLQALSKFFIAVMLVIVGTYYVFTASSIVFLKLLKKSKKIYYKPNNFTAISGLIYRMKQNAVGLSNICILSTMVLIIFSTTFSLYLGLDNNIKQRFSTNTIISSRMPTWEEKSNFDQKIESVLKDKNIKTSTLAFMPEIFTVALREGDVFQPMGRSALQNIAQIGNLYGISIWNVEDVNKISSKEISLPPEEIMIVDNPQKTTWKLPELNFAGQSYKINHIGLLETDFLNPSQGGAVMKGFSIVMGSKAFENLSQVLAQLPPVEGLDATDTERVQFMHTAHVDIVGSQTQILEQAETLETYFKQEGSLSTLENAQIRKDINLSLYGSLMFLGIFLGGLFLVATVLIIYYKQISEGYDDRFRFQIMHQVGMSEKETKQTIQKQVLMVFFLPLIMAGIHVLASFSIVTKLLYIFELSNDQLFAQVTLGVFVVFALMYSLVYKRTAKTYYQLVKSKDE